MKVVFINRNNQTAELRLIPNGKEWGPEIAFTIWDNFEVTDNIYGKEIIFYKSGQLISRFMADRMEFV